MSATSVNNSVIYWKWDDSTLKQDIACKVADLCERMEAGAVFVAIHWIHRRLDDPILLNAIEECCHALHERQRKLYLELCPRNEGEAFLTLYPRDAAHLTWMTEVPLDQAGMGGYEFALEPVYHYWRTFAKPAAVKLFGAWSVEIAGIGQYRRESLKPIADHVQFTEDNDTQKISVKITAGAEHAGTTAVVCLGLPQPIPDLASPRLGEFYAHLLQTVSHIPLDGVCSDEWGYDVILKIEEENPYNDKKLFLRHLSVSQHFAEIYEQNHPGACFQDDLLHLHYTPLDDEAVRIAAINRYVSTLRAIMAGNDREMYSMAKAQFGQGTFYGVHPTWWGSVDSLNFEVFKNGFYWWEAKRDVAQTDELVIMPIRLALARKWGGSIWYNMWYSMGTRDLNTYYKETWNNVRFGGRTHYLGYECPNEAVVLELCPPGVLEEIERMDARVRMLDQVQAAQPDSRVLILFGYEAVTNWALVGTPVPPWTPRNELLDQVLNTANRLFERILCDLAPTSELENGSIAIEQGLAVYNGHSYDAVVLFYPESMGRKCYASLKLLDSSRLFVCGKASIYADGAKVAPVDAEILATAAVIHEDIPPADLLADELTVMGAKSNRFANGCILTDGTAIFTADGNLPSGNPLHVSAVIGDFTIEFSGEDFLFVKPDCENTYTLYPGKGTLIMRKKGSCKL